MFLSMVNGLHKYSAFSAVTAPVWQVIEALVLREENIKNGIKNNANMWTFIKKL